MLESGSVLGTAAPAARRVVHIAGREMLVVFLTHSVKHASLSGMSRKRRMVWQGTEPLS